MAPETLDSLDRDSLKPLVLQLLARIDALIERNGALGDEIKTLLARIAELEAKLGQPPKTPGNSSLPPSRAQKANVCGPPRAKKGRTGRPGVARALCANPDVTHDVYADRCTCGAALIPADQPHAFAYDHIDLPPIKPVTTRINLHKGQCPCCKRRVTARPPADMMPGSPFGPGIASVVTYLHACQMVSYNRMTEVLDGLFGLKLSEGAIANMLARAAKPFAAQAAEIAQTVRKSPVIASDETSARVSGKTQWQWTFLAASAGGAPRSPTPRSRPTRAIWGATSTACSISSRPRPRAATFVTA
jgi:transposase